MTPIGITYPILRGNVGFFNVSYDTMTQIKTNLTMLLNTKYGERRMNPEFCINIEKMLFSENTDATAQIIRQIIEDKIKRWMPDINILNITFFTDSDTKNKSIDMYIIYAKIEFEYAGQTDFIQVELQTYTE